MLDLSLGLELRDYRRCNQLKQEYVANLLGVSQSYISRIEAGSTEPDPETARRMEELFARPENIPVDRHIENLVRRSPHFDLLVQEHPKGLKVQAASQSWLDDPISPVAISNGEVLPTQQLIELGCQIHRLAGHGAFEGRVAYATALWEAPKGKRQRFWREHINPVMKSAHSWVIHSTLVPISEAERETLFARWDSTLHLELFEQVSAE